MVSDPTKPPNQFIKEFQQSQSPEAVRQIYRPALDRDEPAGIYPWRHVLVISGWRFPA
jgi:hypothetical protein